MWRGDRLSVTTQVRGWSDLEECRRLLQNDLPDLRGSTLIELKHVGQFALARRSAFAVYGLQYRRNDGLHF